MALYTVAGGGTIQAADLNQLVQALNGAVATALTMAGAVTLSGGVAGQVAASGNVTANGNRCVEGTAAVTHLEAYPAQGSSGSLAANAVYTVTFSFARAFNVLRAVSASCSTSAGNKGAIGCGVTAVSTTAVTVAFQNLDANPQTLSNFSILAIGS